MNQYLYLLGRIYSEGTSKHPTREGKGPTKNPCRGLPNLHFSHNLQESFPLLTTREIHWRGLVGELRSFLQGCTNEKGFAANGCNFWKPWARKGGSLGPIYGAAWADGDQLGSVIRKLREEPHDRRMVVSAWIPSLIPQMVLPPCHITWCVTVYDGRLNLTWLQRSADFPIGVPYNIASYGLLTHLLAKWAGLEPGQIDCIFCDAHIYENQLAGVEEQLKRTPGELPEVNVWFEDERNFWSWNCELVDYFPQGKISMGEVEV